MNINKIICRFVGLCLTALIALPAVADKTKVGFVYVGPVADAGWTYEHDQGRLAVDKK